MDVFRTLRDRILRAVISLYVRCVYKSEIRISPALAHDFTIGRLTTLAADCGESAPFAQTRDRWSWGLIRQYVSPREVEYGPNPVIERHVLNYPDGKHDGVEACDQEGRDSQDYGEGDRTQSTHLNDRISEQTFPTAAVDDRDLTHTLDTGSVLNDDKMESADQLPMPASSVQYICSECSTSFRTAGEKNKHINRKHRRRYICPDQNCQRAFGLSADLKRHQRSVHQATEEVAERRWKCFVPGCRDPDKLFDRKDNYTRHVRRCEERLCHEKHVSEID